MDSGKVICRDGKIYLMNEVSREDFLEEFPTIVQLNAGNFGFLNRDKDIVIPFDKNDKELLTLLDIPEDQLNYFNSCGKNEDNDIFELVKSQGLENEHCLIFKNRILFHSESKEEVEKYEKLHKYISFIKYGPI